MKRIVFSLLWALIALSAYAQTTDNRKTFARDFSPAEGLVSSYEKPFRDEICLNGLWEVQCIDVPQTWKKGSVTAPELPAPDDNRCDDVKIRIPSPVNVNNWGQGYITGENTRHPYVPSSVYFPSYPKHWNHARMAWLRKNVTIPQEWKEKRIVLHFEAVAGESRIIVNGTEIHRNFESHLPFDVDITDHVRHDKPNEIMVGLRHTRLFDKSHPEYRYMGATYPTGSNTDDLLGIWQDVMLWAQPKVRIKEVFIQPWVDKGELIVEVSLENTTDKRQKIEVSGEVREWINHVKDDELSAAEIDWSLGETALQTGASRATLEAESTRTITLVRKIGGELKFWSPDSPNLYTLLLSVNGRKGKIDCKAERFGWRQFKIVNGDFHLNGERIQCFGDIQHPFSAYICSRRFAYAWYRMIKDFGGNAVRPHAQPWPRVYYDLADEMGLLVLDETAVFGSSIRMNFEEDITWERSKEHLRRLILRDRNHPSVIGWSSGNETFAIALLNKPSKEIAARWDDKLIEMTMTAFRYDPTREFVTLDGDRDMNGTLPVWSKHFGHNLNLHDLPKDIDKPLVVGECGATYYGRPIQLYPFVGERAFECYEGRNEALAIDIFQNVRYMAQPLLDYFSSSEVCWFGLEHLPLGYDDFSRLPSMKDGIFAGKPYEEGRYGYQYERIPPYVTTFNPGLDPSLPLYRPLAMFNALKAALNGGTWQEYKEVKHPARKEYDRPRFSSAYIAGTHQPELLSFLDRAGINIGEANSSEGLFIIDAESVTADELVSLDKMLAKYPEALVLLLSKGEKFSSGLIGWLPADVQLTSRKATSLVSDKEDIWGSYFEMPELYFAECEGDRHILKAGMDGELLKIGKTIFKASETDWNLFNNVAEHWKCAQVVLYEHLEKPCGAGMVRFTRNDDTIVLSVLDYTISTKENGKFWQKLLNIMRIQNDPEANGNKSGVKEHDLLMDGPVD